MQYVSILAIPTLVIFYILFRKFLHIFQMKKSLSVKEIMLPYEKSPLLVFCTDFETGELVDVNDSFQKVLGYTQFELLQNKIMDIHLWTNGVAIGHIKEILKLKQNVHSFEMDIKQKNGSICALLASHSLVFAGGKQYIITTAMDISERKRTENRLMNKIEILTSLKSEQEKIRLEDVFKIEDLQHLQDLFANATNVASIITAVDGTPITRPSNFTRLCKDIIRKTSKGCANCYLSDSIIGRKNPAGPIVQTCLSGGLWDGGASITIGDVHVANWLIGQVRDSTQTPEMMIRYAREIGIDDKLFLEAFDEVPQMTRERFDAIAKALFAFAAQLSTQALQNFQQNRYIKELQKIERELGIAEKKAIAASDAKSVFLANISHEMRTPLNSILGIVELLEESPLNELQRQYIATMTRNGDILYKIIENVLELAKFEKGEHEITLKPISIKESVINSFTQYSSHPKIKSLSIKMVTEFEPLLSEWIWADSEKLKQVLDNLIDNAIKFTNAGVVRIYVGAHDEQFLKIVVSDTGVGIPEDLHPHLFEHFYQVDSSLTRKYGGSGIGLSIAKQLVKLMGGELTLRSELSVGSVFTFTIPYRKADAVIRPSSCPKELNPSGEIKILVVDDAEDNRILLTRFFKEYPCKLDLVENGELAVLKFMKHDYDLILMDISMPVMDGHTATRKIREIETKEKRPKPYIIALSAYTLATERQLAHEAGVDYFMAKPVKKQELLKYVSEISFESHKAIK